MLLHLTAGGLIEQIRSIPRMRRSTIHDLSKAQTMTHSSSYHLVDPLPCSWCASRIWLVRNCRYPFCLWLHMMEWWWTPVPLQLPSEGILLHFMPAGAGMRQVKNHPPAVLHLLPSERPPATNVLYWSSLLSCQGLLLQEYTIKWKHCQENAQSYKNIRFLCVIQSVPM